MRSTMREDARLLAGITARVRRFAGAVEHSTARRSAKLALRAATRANNHLRCPSRLEYSRRSPALRDALHHAPAAPGRHVHRARRWRWPGARTARRARAARRHIETVHRRPITRFEAPELHQAPTASAPSWIISPSASSPTSRVAMSWSVFAAVLRASSLVVSGRSVKDHLLHLARRSRVGLSGPAPAPRARRSRSTVSAMRRARP